ncbi:MAG: isoprenylcysteine carboxylmethyltransferase family protein [Chloroflexi bacterium]|nr:isoprenylcysteine carboxylmethyltransferase family protein [Chloroflexota bacterium]
MLNDIELWIRALGAIAGMATLAIALAAMFVSIRRPVSREEPGALLWRPLPIHVPPWLQAATLTIGGPLFFGGLALYLWGLFSLGRMFAPSSGFGVRVQAAHRLITTGPYAHVRHPMYLAVIAAALGGLLLYRTWAALCFAVIMFGLAVRARREERVLSQEFGPEWQAYASRVPAWLPRFGRGRRSGA